MRFRGLRVLPKIPKLISREHIQGMLRAPAYVTPTKLELAWPGTLLDASLLWGGRSPQRRLGCVPVVFQHLSDLIAESQSFACAQNCPLCTPPSTAHKGQVMTASVPLASGGRHAHLGSCAEKVGFNSTSATFAQKTTQLLGW